LRTFGDEVKATVVRVFAYIGAITVLAVLAASYFETPELHAAIDPAPRSDWANVERPYRSFSLVVPNYPEADYVVRRHAAGGRKDIMIAGAEDVGGSRLMLEVYRPGRDHERFADAASEVVARTAELGGPYALRPVEDIVGKFGHVSVFEFTARTDGRDRNCLGFARTFTDPPLQIAGWYCKGDAEVVDRRTLACAIEGLSLLAAAGEPRVQELFARAEERRTFCTPRTATRARTLQHSDWLEAPQGPKLRRSLTSR
jgi:hypothetical protein